jgi:hypothetical protein
MLKTSLLSVVFCLIFLSGNGAAPELTFTRPTLVAIAYEQEPRNPTTLLQDKDFLFSFRGFGKKEFTAGFFVQDIATKHWIEVKKLSTENAKLGRSPSPEKGGTKSTWDYSDLAKRLYVELPLRTSDTLDFPDRIAFDEANHAYRLDFNSKLNVEESLSTFWITRSDLEEAFKDAE